MIIKTLISRTLLAGIMLSLYACGGGGGGSSDGPVDRSSSQTVSSNVTTEPSSSQGDTQSSSTVTTSVPGENPGVSSVGSSAGNIIVPDGDVAAGKARYVSDCASCHGDDAKKPGGVIDLEKSEYRDAQSGEVHNLAGFIQRYMPRPGGSCGPTCAKNIAAYLYTLRPQGGGASSAPSSIPAPNPGVSSAVSSSVQNGEPTSSAQSVGTTSSTPNSVGASSVGTSAEASSAANSQAPMGDINRGRELYTSANLFCSGCHAADGSGGGVEMYRLNLSKVVFVKPSTSEQLSLAQYINKYMPSTAPGNCDTTCAQDIAAYLNSWSAGSSVPSSQASSSQVSSAVSSVQTSTPTSTSSSAPAAPVGNVASGKTFYTDLGCAGCHGTNGEGNQTFPAIDANKSQFKYVSNSPEPLRPFLINQMLPVTPNTSACKDQCVSDLIAYMKTLSTVDLPPSSTKDPYADWTPPNADSCGVTYGPRSLRLLTRLEFANSVEDLTGVNIQRDLGASTYDALPADLLVAGFSNNVMATIEPGALQAYDFVINKVIDKIIENEYAGVVSCGANASVEECGAKLIEEFMPRIFRRNITDSEVEDFSLLFSSEYSGGVLADGMRLALRTMFTSPNFLYRDETGVLVSELGKTPDEPRYDMVGTARQLAPANTDVSYYEGFDNVPYAAGINIIEITAKSIGKLSNGSWPVLRVQAFNKDYSITVSTTYNKVYRIVLPSRDSGGSQHIGIASGEGKGKVLMASSRIYAAKIAEIQAPKVELDPDAYVLTPNQLASYLAFTFTGSTPDAELLRAANEGDLDTNLQIETQVARLLKTPRARQHFGNYAAQWLRADRVLDRTKSPTDFPGFSQDVRNAMAQEVRDVFNHIVVDGQGSYTDLFNGKFTFVNKALADFYGINGVTGDQMRKVSTTNRAGLLTSGAFMAVNAHEKDTAPILRAVNMRKAFLCHDVPAPPTGIALNGENVDAAREESIRKWEEYLAANDNKAPARLKYEHQTSAALCQTCHKEMINPLGGGMEDFDAVGRLQTQDYNGFHVNFDGTMYGLDSINDGRSFGFSGAVDLANQIANLDSARACFVDNSFRLAMGTGASYFDREKSIWLNYQEKDSYSCNANTLESKLQSEGTVAMLKALGSLDSVRYRKNVTR